MLDPAVSAGPVDEHIVRSQQAQAFAHGAKPIGALFCGHSQSGTGGGALTAISAAKAGVRSAALSVQSGVGHFGVRRTVPMHVGSIIPFTGIVGITPVDGSD